jgi:hypothetical protein
LKSPASKNSVTNSSQDFVENTGYNAHRIFAFLASPIGLIL